jgi:hypothetical protein
MALPFSSGETMIDDMIFRLGTYPQDSGTRPSSGLSGSPFVVWLRGVAVDVLVGDSCRSSVRDRGLVDS